MNIRKLWQCICPPEEKKQHEPTPCIVHVIGGPSDRHVLKAIDHGETTEISGLLGDADEYSLATWWSQGDSVRLLVHKTFSSQDVFRLLLNEYCRNHEVVQ